MDRLQFIAALVGSLAWPSALVFVVLLLRKPLLRLPLRTLRYGDLSAEFGETLQELETEAEQLPAPGPDGRESADVDTMVREVARTSPNAAVVAGWLEVERELRSLATRVLEDTQASKLGPHQTIGALRAGGHLPALTGNLLEEFRLLRNKVAHGVVEVSRDEAVRYGSVAGTLVRTLRSLPLPSEAL